MRRQYNFQQNEVQTPNHKYDREKTKMRKKVKEEEEIEPWVNFFHCQKKKPRVPYTLIMSLFFLMALRSGSLRLSCTKSCSCA